MQTQTRALIRRQVAEWTHARTLQLPIIVICFGILLFSYLRQYPVCIDSPRTCDFFTYYNAALAVRHGQNPLVPVVTWIAGYTPGGPLASDYYVYAPFFALLLVPLTYLPFPIALAVWGITNIAFLPLTVTFIARIAGARLSVVTVAVLAAASSLITPVRIELWWGQADIMLLFLLAAALAVRLHGRPRLAGLLLAVACVTKPPLLLFVPFLLWKREVRFAIATTLGFLVMVFAPFLWLGGQAFQDQVRVWQFWSNQYVSFIDNNSPKGVLSRLFTINPNAPPVIVAPTLVTALWLVVVLVVVVCSAVLIKPQPLRRDTYTLLEIGLVLCAMFLISPLTEYIYLTLLIIPLCSIYIFASTPSARATARSRQTLRGGVLAGWLLLCLPWQSVEYFFWPRMQTPSPLAHVYVLLAAVYLYVAVAFFIFQLAVLAFAQDTSFSSALRQVLTHAPLRTRQWIRDTITPHSRLRSVRVSPRADPLPQVAELNGDLETDTASPTCHAPHAGSGVIAARAPGEAQERRSR